MPHAMKSSTGTKIFVGNLSSQATSDVIRKLFEEYGGVSECDVLKNYGFVHMDSPENAEKAIDSLNGHEVLGQKMVVEASTGSGGRRDPVGDSKGAIAGIRRGGTKIFVGNLPIQATPDYIRKQFEEYGTVMECDIMKNYGFIHMDTPENAQKAIENLHGADIFGQSMTVEASTSEVRRNPGMGGANKCFRCGSAGHWSKDCPDAPPGLRRRMGSGPGPMRGYRGYDHRRDPYGPPLRERYDPYDRYDPYGRYDDRYLPPPRRLPPPPPPPPRRPLSPMMVPAYSRRSPDPRDYPPPRREYSPERRFAVPERRIPPPPPPEHYPPAPRREERDPYALIPSSTRDHYPPPPPPRDHYPPPVSSEYRREYPPAPPRDYSPPSRRYPPPPPPPTAREYSPPSDTRYIAPASIRDNLPRAYGGTGGRLSPVSMARRM